MNGQQIEYFLSAAKHLNFTRAADEFHTSQPTISRQVALLEDELGFELFIRDKSSLRLTVGGAIMAQEFTKAIQIIQDGITRVGRVSEGLEGELSLGYVFGMNTDMYIHPPITSFVGNYPAIQITLETASFAGLRKKLESGEFDIIFTLDFELPSFKNAFYRRIYHVDTIIAMSSSHPLASKEALKIEDFSGETFLVPSPAETNFGRTDIVRILGELGVKDIKLRNVNNHESRLFGVRSVMGVAFLDTSMECVFDNRYKSFKLPKAEFNALYIVAVWKKDNLNPVIPIFAETLRENLNLSSDVSEV